jgi:diguanylate cyclase (GGDEF)-like protein
VLACLGGVLVLLLLLRQYVTLAQNRRLTIELSRTSTELETRLSGLASLNQRLEVLNGAANRLSSLNVLPEVIAGGLELACCYSLTPAGWISLKDKDGREYVAATRGSVDEHHPGDGELNAAEVEKGILRSFPLDIRGETIGTVWLVRPAAGDQETSLLPVIAAHIATAIDNTQRYEEAVHLAERDPLTGLFNHRGIHKRLAGESLRAQQNDSELSLVMMDLDDFKELNDTYGHPAGDAALRKVADAIRSVLRHADLAGRVGGDELLLVLLNTGADGAMQLTERLRETLSTRPLVTPNGASIPLHLSFGLATYPVDAQSLGQLIEAADTNLYASKQRGGDSITGCTHQNEEEADGRGLLGMAGRLLDAVGARDHYTRKHSEHVMAHALSLGEALGLPEESLSTLQIAAMLHDVGKIRISGSLLRKPAPLSSDEQATIRRHVDTSASIIGDMPRLIEVVEAVQAHHERYDGHGYPAGSYGEDTPLLARILAVADAYSAMTLERPYRKRLSREQARAELLRVAGTQLDPELVDRFIEVLEAADAEHGARHAAAG